jgi:hypothetical protein
MGVDELLILRETRANFTSSNKSLERQSASKNGAKKKKKTCVTEYNRNDTLH